MNDQTKPDPSLFDLSNIPDPNEGKPDPNDLLSEISDLPPAPPRYHHILDPYKETVLAFRSKGYSPQYIADFFSDRGVEVSASTVRNYFRKVDMAERREARRRT